MHNAYIFLYNDEVGTREQVKTFIDGRSEIVNWKYELPNSFFLISPNSAQELSTIIQSFTGEKGRFLIAECGSNRQGWLDKGTWTFLKEKKHVNDT